MRNFYLYACKRRFAEEVFAGHLPRIPVIRMVIAEALEKSFGGSLEQPTVILDCLVLRIIITTGVGTPKIFQ